MSKKPTYEELEKRVKELEKEATERKNVEKKLRYEKRRLESLIEYSSLAIVTLDEGHSIISCNRDFEELFHFKESEIIGRNLDELIVGQKYIEDAISYTKETLKGKAIHGSGKRQRKDGAHIDVQFTGVPVIIDGKVIGAYGIYRDISDRKRTEEALRESEERLQAIFESNPSPLVAYDTEGHAQYVNPAFTELFGWSMDELKGRRIPFVPDDQKEITGKKLGEVYSTGKNVQFETKRLTRQGDVIDVIVSGAYIKGLEGEPVQMIANLTDISERKKLEAQLQQALRMESLGTLAGGIAHDFNNLLMGIQGRASLMVMDKDYSHPDFEHLKGIEDYVKSAADLTRQLLGFARGGKYEVKPTDINDLIKKTSTMFGRTKKEITIRSKYQEDVWVVDVDRGQIDQVLMNLLVNALQAMPGGGDVYLETENVTLDEIYVKPFNVESGNYVKVSITDTGVGMDEATRTRIFDPFFTTKEMGRGMGLGLASAYGIIKNHGGFINVYSEKGEGTTFNIYLPAIMSEVRDQRSEVSDDARHGDETILFVDDEEMIIDVGKQLLEKLGYKVLTAESGKEAIEIYNEKKENIHMVILDMVMPGIGGGETYDKLKKICPDIKVLLSSGYSINGKATEILDRGCTGFIQKPFNIKDLSQKLREILDNE